MRGATESERECHRSGVELGDEAAFAALTLHAVVDRSLDDDDPAGMEEAKADRGARTTDDHEVLEGGLLRPRFHREAAPRTEPELDVRRSAPLDDDGGCRDPANEREGRFALRAHGMTWGKELGTLGRKPEDMYL